MRIPLQLLERMGRYWLPAMFFLLFSGTLRLVAQTAPAAPAPVKLTAAEDRQRLLDRWKIREEDMRRPPASGANAPNATNYDESKANLYPNLPDPLVFKDGQRVTSAHGWALRRKEIKEDFDREILGRPPEGLPKVTWEVLSTTPETYAGIAVVTKRLQGHVDNSSYLQLTVNLEMTLTTPAHAAGPVPVLMELAFARDFQNALARPVPTPIAGAAGSYGIDWQPVLARGWGFAVLSPTSYQEDDGSGLTAGIIGLMNKGQPRKLDDWGALRAWAWGASRALDYFETDPAVDARQVGLAGHSRFGKTALVTLAYDPRFAIAYVSSSGEGGAKLYRHIFGEQISNLTSPSLYHWMDGNFLKYGGPLTPADLPVDNHELIALCAPRPVFIGGGASSGDGYVHPGGDAWADPRGMFLAEVAAGPVYRLLGKKDLGTTVFPPIETPLIAGDLAFRQHSGGHTPAPNWPVFLEFASRYLLAPEAKAASTDVRHER